MRRDAAGNFYISHDPHPRSPENALEAYEELFQRHSGLELAINVKELGYEPALVELMNSGRLGKRSFYFDFELLEPQNPGAAQRRIRALPKSQGVRLASRLSDRGEALSQCLAIPGEIVWADEFDSLWLTAEKARKVREAGRLFYVISPELHGFDAEARKRRWQDFKDWRVDGICTDYPLEARKFFGS